MKVPESLKEEHEAFIDGLKSHSTRKDRTGAAVRQLLKLLEPHVEKEDELVLPLLGALGQLAAGEPLEDSSAVTRAYEKYAGQYRRMFTEHSPIRQAIKKARGLAKDEGYGDVVEILDALAHHSKVEEEVLYPAALLAGKVGSLPRLAAEEKDAAQISPRMAVNRAEPAGGLSYFALDYDAPISSVTERLVIKHEEIDAILSEVEELADKGKLKVSISLLNATSPLILRSAVEEEARVMQVVMQKNKSRAQRSVAITREHRDIADFLRHQLPELTSKPPDEARRSIIRFVRLVHGHLKKEEKFPFSLAVSE
ncbi:MAG: hemerythrin domain-containing protein, partial [Nitrososphaerales archaeon]